MLLCGMDKRVFFYVEFECMFDVFPGLLLLRKCIELTGWFEFWGVSGLYWIFKIFLLNDLFNSEFV